MRQEVQKKDEIRAPPESERIGKISTLTPIHSLWSCVIVHSTACSHSHSPGNVLLVSDHTQDHSAGALFVGREAWGTDAPPYWSSQLPLRVWSLVGKGGGGLMKELVDRVLCVSIAYFFVVPLQ